MRKKYDALGRPIKKEDKHQRINPSRDLLINFIFIIVMSIIFAIMAAVFLLAERVGP